MNKLTNMLNEVEYEGNIKSIDRITICKLVGSVCCNMLLDDLTVKQKQGLVRLALRAGDYLQTRLLMEVNDDKEKDQNNSQM